tara:strand:+ start:347 stop:595 length:249 start_codon:yes stop_codon:yes gene_type:complete
MVAHFKKDVGSSKANLTQRKKSGNEFLADVKIPLSKLNFSVSESANKVESSPAVKFNAFWVEFSALVSELEALATKIKALDD